MQTCIKQIYADNTDISIEKYKKMFKILEHSRWKRVKKKEPQQPIM